MNNDRKGEKEPEDITRTLHHTQGILKRAHRTLEVHDASHDNRVNQPQYNPITSPYGNCSNVSLRYKKQCRIGEGTYGIVYKALDVVVTKQMVALKRCLPHHEASDGFPITTLREIQILKELKGHDNIVQLKEVAVSSKQSGVFLVFEFAHFDLANLVDEYYAKYRRSPFTIPETKCLSSQLLSAVQYLHDKCIIHRDLKLSNLLYDKDKGMLKLCDFGLARRISKCSRNTSSTSAKFERRSQERIIPMTPPPEHLTPKVVSLWYRPPELLLNSYAYGFAIDLWGVGCIIAELLLGVPLFKGKDEMSQLRAIVDLLGNLTVESWPGLKEMPLFQDGSCELPFQRNIETSQRDDRSKFLDTFSNLSTAGIMLLSNLLRYDPETRLTAEDAHASQWFQEYPKPTRKEDMPTFPWKIDHKNV